ncbi:MAG TPA: hypothetical protein VFM18_10870, partial [Methanosarcina sp.]|nr:hypothetical protein [Methanosarcina sp.]
MKHLNSSSPFKVHFDVVISASFAGVFWIITHNSSISILGRSLFEKIIIGSACMATKHLAAVVANV